MLDLPITLKLEELKRKQAQRLKNRLLRVQQAHIDAGRAEQLAEDPSRPSHVKPTEAPVSIIINVTKDCPTADSAHVPSVMGEPSRKGRMIRRMKKAVTIYKDGRAGRDADKDGIFNEKARKYVTGAFKGKVRLGPKTKKLLSNVSFEQKRNPAFGVLDDKNPYSPAGVYFETGKKLFVRNLKDGSILHEFGHAVDTSRSVHGQNTEYLSSSKKIDEATRRDKLRTSAPTEVVAESVRTLAGNRGSKKVTALSGFYRNQQFGITNTLRAVRLVLNKSAKGTDGDGDGIFNENGKPSKNPRRRAYLQGLKAQKDRANRVGDIGNVIGSALGSAAGTAAGALTTAGVGSIAGGLIGNVAGGLAGESLGRRIGFAAQSKDIRQALRRMKTGFKETKPKLGESIGGLAGYIAGSRAGLKVAAKNSLGFKGRLASDASASLAGLWAGQYAGNKISGGR